uniref:endo-polygalacturonase n=1 Tax=Apolygus lucorum TaxID=248454 RepID=V9LKK7_APOLU|nr:polygalacturonase 4 [Apolygus lucorum]
MSTTGLALGCLFFVIASASAQYFELKNVNQLAEAKKFQKIVIRDLQVPSGVTLDLTNLKDGTTVEFAGKVTFGYHEWRGPLVKISGKKLNIYGYDYARFDGEGHRYWKGGRNTKLVKPRFLEAIKVDDSRISNLYFKNSPAMAFLCNWCHNVAISKITVDNKDAGDGRAGRAFNTDGISLGYATNITVRDSYVFNQDDCFVTGGGSDMTIDNLICEGGNGISVGSLGRGADVVRLTIKNSKVINSLTGLNIKTETNAVGLHRDVTFENIELRDIHQYGISIHGNEGPTYPLGDPTYFIIDRLTMRNIRGTMKGPGAANVWIWLHPNSATNWKWENVHVTGGKSAMFKYVLTCKGIPANLKIPCAEK